MRWRIENGDALATLQGLEPSSVQCCVTSPPYWGLRDYGVDGQFGLEPTPEEYVERMVEVFREVRRVLRDDGTLWLNLGDSFHNKQLAGIPWRVAFALQADGWYLRSDIIWHKPNPMPESVTDRPTKSHEYLFLMTKSARYFYDAGAIAEPFADERMGNPNGGGQYAKDAFTLLGEQSGLAKGEWNADGSKTARNKRTLWTVPTQPFPGAHFAVMPPDLVEPCIKAGTKKGDMVLDPFSGAGTVGVVATRLKRSYVGIEINPEYAEMSRRRIEGDAPLFNRSGVTP